MKKQKSTKLQFKYILPLIALLFSVIWVFAAVNPYPVSIGYVITEILSRIALFPAYIVFGKYISDGKDFAGALVVSLVGYFLTGLLIDYLLNRSKFNKKNK